MEVAAPTSRGYFQTRFRNLMFPIALCAPRGQLLLMRVGCMFGFFFLPSRGARKEERTLLYEITHELDRVDELTEKNKQLQRHRLLDSARRSMVSTKMFEKRSRKSSCVYQPSQK